MEPLDDDMSAGGFWLQSSSDEYSELRHYLISCLRGREVEKLEIWKIENNNLYLKFEKKSSNILTLPCWQKESTSDTINTVQNICKKGFKCSGSSNGIQFFHGTFENNLLQVTDATKDHVYVYADVCVGRSYVVDESSEKEIPDGYNSLYLLSNKMDRDNDGEFSIKEYQSAANFDSRPPLEYRHEYRVIDDDLINPKYIFRFSLADREKERGVVDRRPLSNSLESYVFFDPTVNKPLTLRDKMSSGFNASQRLLPIDDAFNQAIIESRQADPVITGKHSWIDNQLDSLDEKLRTINLNYADVHEEITGAADKAIRQLQSITKHKLESILSIEIELRRQLEQFAWINTLKENHIKRLTSSLQDERLSLGEKNLGKVDFLKSWRSYTLYANALSRSKYSEVQVLPSIMSDMCLHSDLNVYVGKKKNEAGLPLPTDSVFDDINENEVTTAKDYLSSAHRHAHFSATARPSHDLLSASLQSLLNQKQNNVQEALGKALSDHKYPLPISLSGHIISGSKYSGHIYQEVQSNSHFGSRNVADVDNGNYIDPRLLFMDKLNVATGGESSLNNSTQGNYLAPESQENITEGADLKISNSQMSRSLQRTGLSTDHRPLTSNNVQSIEISQINSPNFNDALNQTAKRFSSMEYLQKLSLKFRQHSLRDMADRKFKLFQLKNISGYESSIQALAQGSILSLDEAQTIFFNLPFFASPPSCKLLYSTDTHKRNLDDMFMKTLSHRGASLVIVRANGFKFGAYLSHPLVLTGSWTGSPACFLFNLTLDLKFPYHARVPPPASAGGPVAFLVDRDQLLIGNGDLRINSDLKAGSTVLEGCYGIGLSLNSPDAATCLCGAESFVINQLEVWGINI